MKNTFRKILAVGMTLALVSSFFAAVPVSAQPGCNDWGEIPMPVLAPDTEPGVMDIASDGTMFLALYDEIARTWDIVYSTDGGFNWEDTNLTGIYDEDPNDLYGFADDEGTTPVRIQVSPMWPDNKNVYVALSNGDVWRLPNAGLGTPALLKPIVSLNSTYLEDEGWGLWDMDIWADGTYNYLVVATDLDVFVLKDQLLNDWVDYELNEDSDDGSWWGNRRAVEVRFAPDFATSELIWAVVAEDNRTHPVSDTWVDWTDNDLILTSADSPARWGYVFQEVAFEQYDTDLEWWTPFVDMEFDPAYTSQSPQLYVAVAQPAWINSPNKPGNLYYVTGEASSTGPGETFSNYIFFEDRALGSVEVSGNTIMVQDTEDGTVWTTTDGGANWDEAVRSPAAPFWGQLYMSPNFEEDQTVFSTVMDYFGFSGIGGVYRSIDGGKFFDGISLLDMTIDEIVDLAFDPKGGSQPVLMIVADGLYNYIFYTDDATAEKPQWMLKDSEENFLGAAYDFNALEMISWDEAGDTVMLMVRDGMPWDDAYKIYRSTDDGNSFKFWRTIPTGTIGYPKDWAVVDYSIVNVIGLDGYWGTRLAGTPVTNTTVASTDNSYFSGDASIARSADGNIAVGYDEGQVALSTDNGATWKKGDIGDGVVYVAFGPDGTLYGVTSESSVQEITVGAIGLTGTALLDSNEDNAEAVSFSGVWVSPDDTLYAIGYGDFKDVNDVLSISGGIQLANDASLLPGTTTFDLGDMSWTGVEWEYTVDVLVALAPNISFVEMTGEFEQGEFLSVVGDDLVWYGGYDAFDEDVMALLDELYFVISGTFNSPSGEDTGYTGYGGDFNNEAGLYAALEAAEEDENATEIENIQAAIDLIEAYLATPMVAGDIIVNGSVSGAYGRVSFELDYLYVTYLVEQGLIEYTGDLIFYVIDEGGWPFPGVSITVTSSALEASEVDAISQEINATMFRLLLGDATDYNVWENKPIEGAAGIWGTVGSNIAWTIVNGNELWAFEDFNSGAVQGVSVVEVDKNAATASKNLSVSWKSLACTSCYTIWVNGEPSATYEVTGTIPAAGTTLTTKLTGYKYDTQYDVQVQACVDGPLQSRLSSLASTTTECYLLAPVALVPVNGMQDASIAPSFVWDLPVDGCVPTSYDFELATDAGFNNIVVSTNVAAPTMGYTYTARDLDYDTNHYWRVRSVFGSLKSAWSPIQNFHTMLEPQAPVDITITQPPDVSLTVPPVVTVTEHPCPTLSVSVPPAVTLTQTVTSVPTPTITMPDQPTPAYIWVIVAVGAILTIAVIVLIIRTRRAE